MLKVELTLLYTVMMKLRLGMPWVAQNPELPLQLPRGTFLLLPSVS